MLKVDDSIELSSRVIKAQLEDRSSTLRRKPGEPLVKRPRLYYDLENTSMLSSVPISIESRFFQPGCAATGML